MWAMVKVLSIVETCQVGPDHRAEARRLRAPNALLPLPFPPSDPVAPLLHADPWGYHSGGLVWGGGWSDGGRCRAAGAKGELSFLRWFWMFCRRSSCGLQLP